VRHDPGSTPRRGFRLLLGHTILTRMDREVGEIRRGIRPQWRWLTWTLRIAAALLIVVVILPTVGTAGFDTALLDAFVLLGLAPDISSLIERVNSGRGL